LFIFFLFDFFKNIFGQKVLGHLFEAIGKNRQADHNKEYGKQFCSIAHRSDLTKANRTQGDHGHVEGIYQAYFG
jgi:hypothetical protein